MSTLRLVLAGLRHFRRTHLGVVVGAALGAARLARGGWDEAQAADEDAARFHPRPNPALIERLARFRAALGRRETPPPRP